MLRLVGDVVGRDQGQRLVDDDVALGAQRMADPAHAHLADIANSRSCPDDLLDPVHQGRVHGLQQPSEDLPSRLAEHGQNRNGDHQADDGVREAEPEGDATGAEEYGETGPSVRACKPSATSAAEPIRRPTWMRYRATSSLPAKPITAAAATKPR